MTPDQPGHRRRQTAFLLPIVFVLSRAFILGAFMTASLDAPDSAPIPLRAALMNWDADYYEHLATQGYTEPRLFAFFPLFPLAVRALVRTFHVDFVWAAVYLNNALFLASLFLVAALGAAIRLPSAGLAAATLLAVHPLSFYFFVPYTESLFLFLTLACFVAALRGRWILAAVAGGLATLTRSTGILLWPALWVLASDIPQRRSRWIARTASLAVPASLLAFMCSTNARYGDFLLFVHGQEAWRDHIHLAVPLAELVEDLGRWRAYLDHHLWLTLLGLAGAVVAARELPRALVVYALPAVLLSLSLNKLAITPRLHLVLFPVWVGWGVLLTRKWSGPRTWTLVVVGTSLIEAYLIWEYVHGRWVE